MKLLHIKQFLTVATLLCGNLTISHACSYGWGGNLPPHLDFGDGERLKENIKRTQNAKIPLEKENDEKENNDEKEKKKEKTITEPKENN